MALAARSAGHMKSMVQRLRAYTTATTPRSKAYSPAKKGDFVPIYVSIGMISLSVSFGVYTGYLHLRENPGVRVSKKTRESVPEVEEPDKVVEESKRLLNKSWFRKVAHVQEVDHKHHVIPDPIRKDQFAHQPRALTLKDVGVDPKMSAPAAH